MRTSALHAELIKLRHAPIWVAFVVLPLVAAAIGTFNYQGNLQILQAGWSDLWTQHTLFEGMFFLHALIGVSCSWLMRLEHRDTNWNQFMASPVGVARMLGAKLVVGWALLGVALAATGMLFVACGVLVGLPGLPGAEYVRRLALAWAGGAAAVACQLLVSLLIRNFAAPAGVAVVGGLAGFLAHAYDAGFAWPYALVVIGLNSNGWEALGPGQVVQLLVASAAYTGCALAMATLVMEIRDVRTS